MWAHPVFDGFRDHPTNRAPTPSVPVGSDEWNAKGTELMQRGKEYPEPRNFFQKYKLVLQGKLDDPEKPKVGRAVRNNQNFKTWYEWAVAGTLRPMTPETYADSYVKKNPCPEEFWRMPWRWPQTKYMNPKIPPPLEGKYQDYYHFVAFRYWFQNERQVYLAEIKLIKEALERCVIREGSLSAMKNCRHIFNKYYSMTRQEELHQAMLYAAYTGNKIMRETPYPEDFVDQKRKIYDDWLTRTRMKQPGDPY